MPTVLPTITASANAEFVNSDLFAKVESRDFLAVSIITLIGLSVSLAFMVLFPFAANSAALALIAA